MNSLPSVGPDRELKLAFCSKEAAEYACAKWHYSKSMPPAKTCKIGVWEDDLFIGVIIFGVGSNNHSGQAFGLNQTQVCELCRVALRAHVAPVSRMVAIALRMLQRVNLGLRLVISYADPAHGHIGAIYQAGNWLYIGQSPKGVHQNTYYRRRDGKVQDWRIVSGKLARAHLPFGDVSLNLLGYRQDGQRPLKWKYIMPLDEEMRQRVLSLVLPYPKRLKDSSEPSAIHAEEGGAAPTQALQSVRPKSECLTDDLVVLR